MIEEYYTPPIISVNGLESIEDVIIKLSEIGFGEFSIETVVSLSSMDNKIRALTEVLQVVQDYKEQVVIYDNGCLINQNGDLVYWFEKAIQGIRNEVTVIIASNNNINMYCLRKNSSIFAQPLTALTYYEWMGLMRVYAKSIQLDLSQEDRSYFIDILTGYPPQVKYCVDLIKDTSIEEVKKKSYLIIENFSRKVTEMLESAIPKEIREDAYGLLAFASSYGIVPSDLLDIVLNIKNSYKRAFSLFKTLTICRYLGITNEYVEVNPVISDYVQRSRFDLPINIRSVLKNRLDEFNKTINTNRSSFEDFENIKYYLKSNIIDGHEIPERFMYSTIYLSSIYDLYNNQKYKQVISIVEKLKNSRVFERYDLPAQIKIQAFYCRALARETKQKFYDEVEFFCQENEAKDINEYNFLRGFMYRHNSEYDKALDRYKNVLEKKPQHKSAMREIVIVYRGLEDFESAYEYAKANYLRDPENPYQIQPYFEILIRKAKIDRTVVETQHIDDMLQTIKRINSTKPSTAYYEILGQHSAYEEKDKERALALLYEGNKKFPESSYIIKVLFDCCEVFRDVQNMQFALEKMEPLTSENKAAKLAYNIRQALYYAYQKKPKDFIHNCINQINGLDNEAKDRLKKRVAVILSIMRVCK